MRENIGLYRGKLKDNDEWVYWNIYGELTADNGKRKKYTITKGAKTRCYYYIYQLKQAIISESIGEYTGLTDKNGNKIWEGDIVKTHYANTKKSDFVETVVFHNGQFCAFHSNNNCKQWAMLYDGVEHLAIDKSVYMDSVEVIGNFHDNPEILKGGVEE